MKSRIQQHINTLQELLFERLRGRILARLKASDRALSCLEVATAEKAPQEPVVNALMDLMADDLVSMVGRDEDNRPLYRAHVVGSCEWCGLLSHHLVAGECPACIGNADTVRPGHARSVC